MTVMMRMSMMLNMLATIVEGDGEDYADVVDDGDVCEACYVGLDARVDVEDAGTDEAGDEGEDNDDDDDRGEIADADGAVQGVDGEDADAEDDEADNASMIIRRMSLPMIRKLLLTVVDCCWLPRQPP